MIHYLFQVVCFQLVFLLVYELLLRRQTFFNWNRAYLLSTSGLSLLLPFIKFDLLSKLTVSYGVIQLPEIIIGQPGEISVTSQMAMEAAGIAVQQPETPLWQVLCAVGSILFGLWFVFQCLRLLWLRSSCPKRWTNNILVVSLKDSRQAFSFFNTVFIGTKIDDKDKALILKHELVHVEQLHSLDVIWFQLLRIVFWFNPCIYWYQNRITEVHEFIADKQVLKDENRSDFYTNLLRQVFQVSTITFTNSFFSKSLIKKRITMISHPTSNRKQLLRYVLIIPVTFLMLVYVSCEKDSEEDIASIESKLDQLQMTVPLEDVKDSKFGDKLAEMETFVEQHPDYVVFWEVVFDTDEEMKIKVLHKKQLPENHKRVERGDSGTYVYFGTNKKAASKPKDQYGKEEVPYAVIDQVPALESCADLSGEDRKKCTSKEIARFVNQNFNTSIATKYALTGPQRIYVSFKIDKQGLVTNIGARAPHPDLEEEAIRVISELPQFIPGRHKGEAVVVPYALPILFQVNE
jgi:bla regulator protein BlaR1